MCVRSAGTADRMRSGLSADRGRDNSRLASLWHFPDQAGGTGTHAGHLPRGLGRDQKSPALRSVRIQWVCELE